MEHKGSRRSKSTAVGRDMASSVLATYLRAYRDLIAVEPIDQNSITVSFPFHLAGSHRVEITVTNLGGDSCILSDAGRTLGEIEDAGHSMGAQVKERLEKLANASGIRLIQDQLVLESSYSTLGKSIQRFLEVSKTIGDVYLVHKERAETEEELVRQVRTVFDSTNVLYMRGKKLHGRVENHPVDFLIPANGHPGVAVNIVAGKNTHTLAQVWYCRCDDIRVSEENKNIRLALIYDVRSGKWSNASKALLNAKADLVVPGDAIEQLPKRLPGVGIVRQ